MAHLRTQRAHRIVVAATAAAALSSTVLAADNTLGFAGIHFMGAGVAPVVAVVAVTLAVVGAIVAVPCRDAPRGIVALCVAGYLLVQSPALQLSTVSPIATAHQAIVPIGIAVAAATVVRRRHATIERVLAAITVVVAVAWAVTAFVPIWLLGFLLIQLGTLAAATGVAGAPLCARFAGFIRGLWASAAIR
jgi:hypothetical protein